MSSWTERDEQMTTDVSAKLAKEAEAALKDAWKRRHEIVAEKYLAAVQKRYGPDTALALKIRRKGPWYCLSCEDLDNPLAFNLAERWWGNNAEVHQGARQAGWIGRETERLNKQAVALTDGRTAEERRALAVEAQAREIRNNQPFGAKESER